MERGSSLPIGFRFHPTDEELVVHYLKKKVCSMPLPATVIPEFDVFHCNPWDLPGELKEKRYFFCKRNLMKKLGTECGYWKGVGKGKQIMAPATNQVIGIKKSFVFIKAPAGLKTHWVVHQFCLVGSITSPYLSQKLMMQVGDWVVCRVYQRKTRKPTNHGAPNSKKLRSLQLQGIRTGANELGFSVARASSSSCSSGITEISCVSDDLDLDQEASSLNS